MKKLAITGFSRSGTTALTDLLNLDPRIKITYERGNLLRRRAPNRRRKWDERNRKLEAMEKHPIYVGDKCTRPYCAEFEKLQNNVDKIIFCLRDPRDIFRSRYWSLGSGDHIEQYISHMKLVLKCDLSDVLFIRYEWAVLNVAAAARCISQYLQICPALDITGHNYKPVRRLGWKKEPEIELPEKVYEIMEEFGYENTSRS